jgi:hypothetical protein
MKKSEAKKPSEAKSFTGVAFQYSSAIGNPTSDVI